MLINILTDNLISTRNLFVNLLNFNIEYESNWFISISSKKHGQVSAFLRTSEFIPEIYQNSCQGLIITCIVEDVEPYYLKAQKLGFNIVEPPRDLPYGQRRLLIKDEFTGNSVSTTLFSSSLSFGD